MSVKIQNNLGNKDYKNICKVLSVQSYNTHSDFFGPFGPLGVSSNSTNITNKISLKNPVRNLSGIRMVSGDSKNYSIETSLNFEKTENKDSGFYDDGDSFQAIDNFPNFIFGDSQFKRPEKKFERNVYKPFEKEQKKAPEVPVELKQIMKNSMNKLGEKYKIKGCEKIFNVSEEELKYIVQVGEKHFSDAGKIEIKTNLDRKIEKNTVKKDLNNFFDITEVVVNTVYDTLEQKFDFDIFTEFTYDEKEISGLARKPVNERFKMNIPKVKFSDVGGCYEAKKELELLAYGLSNPKLYKKWKVKYPKGILLHGPPGNGKTLLAKAMANSAKANFLSLKSTDIFSMFYGQSGKNINSVFEEAKENTPSIVLLDEVDSIAPHRHGTHEESGRVVTSLLENMDGLEEMKGTTVIGTTNFMKNIDSALLRYGRFDKKIEVPSPDLQGREQIYRIHLRGKRIDKKIDYKMLSERSEGLSGADIEAVVQESCKRKLVEDRENEDKNIVPIDTDYILKVIRDYAKTKDYQELENKNLYG